MQWRGLLVLVAVLRDGFRSWYPTAPPPTSSHDSGLTRKRADLGECCTGGGAGYGAQWRRGGCEEGGLPPREAMAAGWRGSVCREPVLVDRGCPAVSGDAAGDFPKHTPNIKGLGTLGTSLSRPSRPPVQAPRCQPERGIELHDVFASLACPSPA